MLQSSPNAFERFALNLAPPTAAIANYCDHVEHAEIAEQEHVAAAANEILLLAVKFATAHDVDPLALYAERMKVIESRSVLHWEGASDGYAAVRSARTWRDLQIAQAQHDSFYHPDVIGLAKSEQLRHYTLHLAKIVGAFAAPTPAHDLVARRLPDTLLFAVKIHTTLGKALTADRICSRL